MHAIRQIWPLIFVAAVAGLLLWLGPVGLAILWPLALVALFVALLWLLTIAATVRMRKRGGGQQ